MANKICSRCGEQVNIMGYSDHVKKHMNKDIKQIIKKANLDLVKNKKKE